jgi:hypothetical protein
LSSAGWSVPHRWAKDLGPQAVDHGLGPPEGPKVEASAEGGVGQHHSPFDVAALAPAVSEREVAADVSLIPYFFSRFFGLRSLAEI